MVFGCLKLKCICGIYLGICGVYKLFDLLKELFGKGFIFLGFLLWG